MELNEIAVEVANHGARLAAVEKKQENFDSLLQAMAAMQAEQEHIKTDVGEIKADVRAIAEKPAKKWDTLITAIITGLIGIALGLLFRGV